MFDQSAQNIKRNKILSLIQNITDQQVWQIKVCGVNYTNICPCLESPLPLICAMYVACLSLLLPSSNCLATILLPAAAWAPSPRQLSLFIRHRLCALMKEVERNFLTWFTIISNSLSDICHPKDLALAANLGSLWLSPFFGRDEQ